jgi:hypothetical protein
VWTKKEKKKKNEWRDRYIDRWIYLISLRYAY